MRLRPFILPLSLIFTLFIIAYFLVPRLKRPAPPAPVAEAPSPTPTASPSATPTPKPLTFAEMNQLYGPCTNTPVLMYHHIEDPALAKTNGQSGLNVEPATFEKHLAYLNQRGYASISPQELINFFNGAGVLPKKSIMLTFDDAYADFATGAVPLLNQYQIKATLFAPTGLLENPDYLKWSDLSGFGANIYIGNHTWSHHNIATNLETIRREVDTAAGQLSARGLDPLKVFAYPYGTISNRAIDYLSSTGYQLAFTTQPGRTLCAKKRLTLPRIRIGNSALSGYGL